MALHYAALSEERMTSALDNVARLCKPGGAFVISTTDAGNMIKYAADDEVGPLLSLITFIYGLFRGGPKRDPKMSTA